MSISPRLLGKLRCPLGGGRLREDGDALVAEATGRRWPFLPSGVPDLFVPSADEASRGAEEANAAFHDACAAEYDRRTARPEEDCAEVAEILARLRREAGGPGEVLDLGCGSGVVLRLAKRIFPFVAGVDVSSAMLARCRPVCGDLCRASVMRLPFADASFCGATAYSLLHHLADPAPAFREFARVLRPGGFLYTDNDSNAAFHARFSWWLAMRRAGKAPRAPGPGGADLERRAEVHHGTGLDPGALREALLAAGFARVEATLHHPPRPDEFTRLLMELERHEPSPSLRYYFRLVAFR